MLFPPREAQEMEEQAAGGRDQKGCEDLQDFHRKKRFRPTDFVLPGASAAGVYESRVPSLRLSYNTKLPDAREIIRTSSPIFPKRAGSGLPAGGGKISQQERIDILAKGVL